ncbi:hypothetical protein GX50_03800 [[Emmonsia] crescens]|uniref:Uncharacterized protein n=1 Tax=[Emmonsia] crescens TaxID=73230 RepID=A0A2B7ZK94_9EURO|nr:hypothetical protein GX50_03800 [Emmonsia crescens]
MQNVGMQAHPMHSARPRPLRSDVLLVDFSSEKRDMSKHNDFDIRATTEDRRWMPKSKLRRHRPKLKRSKVNWYIVRRWERRRRRSSCSRGTTGGEDRREGCNGGRGNKKRSPGLGRRVRIEEEDKKKRRKRRRRRRRRRKRKKAESVGWELGDGLKLAAERVAMGNGTPEWGGESIHRSRARQHCVTWYLLVHDGWRPTASFHRNSRHGKKEQSPVSSNYLPCLTIPHVSSLFNKKRSSSGASVSRGYIYPKAGRHGNKDKDVAMENGSLQPDSLSMVEKRRNRVSDSASLHRWILVPRSTYVYQSSQKKL